MNAVPLTKNPVLQRVLTAAVLLPLFVWLVLGASSTLFASVMALIVFWAAVEWTRLMKISLLPLGIFYPITLLFLLLCADLAIASGVPLVLFVVFSALIFWILATVLVVYYPRSARLWSKNVAVKALMGVFCFVPCWVAVTYIRESFNNGRSTLLFVFFLIWAMDSGAWFVGRKWGRHKLLPAVSPGKTREGLAGGLIAAGLVTFSVLYWDNTPAVIWPGALLICLITALFSVVGDLFESMIKREAGVKDSGCLLPGHGGLLDRIDSILAAAPIFVSGAMMLEIILR